MVRIEFTRTNQTNVEEEIEDSEIKIALSSSYSDIKPDKITADSYSGGEVPPEDD